MDRRNLKLFIGVFVLVLCFGQLQRAEGSNIVANGTFDADTPGSGTAPAGWTLINAPFGSQFFIGGGPTFGSYTAPNSANFGATGDIDDQLLQTLATTSGTTYIFSFRLAHNSTDAENDFHALWNGAHVLDLVNAEYFDYSEFSFSVTATGTSTTIEFDGRENPAWYDLDSVSVTATPEPGTLFLLGTGLLGAGILRRKK